MKEYSNSLILRPIKQIRTEKLNPQTRLDLEQIRKMFAQHKEVFMSKKITSPKIAHYEKIFKSFKRSGDTNRPHAYIHNKSDNQMTPEFVFGLQYLGERSKSMQIRNNLKKRSVTQGDEVDRLKKMFYLKKSELMKKQTNEKLIEKEGSMSRISKIQLNLLDHQQPRKKVRFRTDLGTTKPIENYYQLCYANEQHDVQEEKIKPQKIFRNKAKTRNLQKLPQIKNSSHLEVKQFTMSKIGPWINETHSNFFN